MKNLYWVTNRTFQQTWLDKEKNNNNKRRCNKTQKPRSLTICCSTRDCTIGKVGQKHEMGFRRLVGRAISDSTENTPEMMVIYSVISYLLCTKTLKHCLNHRKSGCLSGRTESVLLKTACLKKQLQFRVFSKHKK